MEWRSGYTMLVVATAANLAQVGTRVVISPLVPRLLSDFAVSRTLVGGLLTGMWALFALAHYPSGVLAERFGSRTVIVAALAATALASGLLAVAPTFPLFGAAMLLLGGSAGLYFVVGTGFVADQFDRGTGQALGLHSSGGAVAGVVVPVVAVLVADRYTWRHSLALTTLFALVVVVVFVRLTRPNQAVKPDGSLVAALHPRKPLRILRAPGLVAPLGAVVVAAFAWQAVITFLPTFLFQYWPLSESQAASLFSVVFVLNAVSMPAVGRLGDRVGNRWALTLCLALSCCGFASVVAGSHTAFLLVGVVCLGVGISYGGAVQSLFMQRFGRVDRVSGFGTVRTVYMLLGSLGGVVTGTLADAFGWGVSYGLVAALLGVTAIAAGVWAAGTT
ncbi:MFS transporter [Haloarcula onubensis]|uniref:MFS transporter n=1 Tax=Haloarcula onubensis TaxID=2950539 RepID=A0ABU2FR69_9EURY|nr:MFS transporter [Halomicroarcula sp. S3CR25-11]MDS0282746.1 MFS transporter [Halomicroarcula sp. S3CR25-11]